MKFVRFVDQLNEKTGFFAAMLVFPLMLIVVYEVILRHIFNSPTVWTYDTLWMLYSMNFLLGGALTLLRKGHIRIDVIHDTFSPKTKLIIDAIIYLLVFFAPCAILTWVSTGYAFDAWASKENLSTTSWAFPAAPIKTIMPITFFLLGLQSVVEVIRNIATLRQKVEL